MTIEDFARDGFAITGPLVAASECEALERRVTDMHLDTVGARNMMAHLWCVDLARQIQFHPMPSSLLPSSFIPVQCTFFEKSAERNWLVPLHQDLSIPVKEKLDHPELAGWSEKEGCRYVQAPAEVLEQLVIVRFHIDDCGIEDGPLRVVPGSHRLGRLDERNAWAERDAQGVQTCCVARCTLCSGRRSCRLGSHGLTRFDDTR